MPLSQRDLPDIGKAATKLRQAILETPQQMPDGWLRSYVLGTAGDELRKALSPSNPLWHGKDCADIRQAADLPTSLRAKLAEIWRGLASPQRGYEMDEDPDQWVMTLDEIIAECRKAASNRKRQRGAPKKYPKSRKLGAKLWRANWRNAQSIHDKCSKTYPDEAELLPSPESFLRILRLDKSDISGNK